MSNSVPILPVEPYPKGDLRRLLCVLAAIDQTPEATILLISQATGLPRQTVTDLIRQAAAQAGVRISKSGSVYRIVEWGPVIKKAGAHLALEGELTGHDIEPEG